MQHKVKILVVEDDINLANNIAEGLRKAGYAIKYTGTAEGANYLLGLERYDLILLDIGLPGKDGLDFCRGLRDHKQEIPVIIITGRIGENCEIEGLNTGADSYITKPFSLEYLKAKIQAVMRRVRNQRESMPKAGPFWMDPTVYKFCINEKAIYLTPRLFLIMEILIRRAGEVVPRDELAKFVWGDNGILTADRNINTQVCKLRQVLDAFGNSRCIETIPHRGYRLNTNVFTSK
ncbi:MAG: response regulator transcription factor [Patescibacteria group bacterium]|nr:response regulator transcription factor [Patescibacteria group bacterium]